MPHQLQATMYKCSRVNLVLFSWEKAQLFIQMQVFGHHNNIMISSSPRHPSLLMQARCIHGSLFPQVTAVHLINVQIQSPEMATGLEFTHFQKMTTLSDCTFSHPRVYKHKEYWNHKPTEALKPCIPTHELLFLSLYTCMSDHRLTYNGYPHSSIEN